MVNFERSFRELRNKMVWVHYALGTLGIISVFWYLMENEIILTPDSPFYLYAIVFFVVYVFIDRASHGILEL